MRTVGRLARLCVAAAPWLISAPAVAQDAGDAQDEDVAQDEGDAQDGGDARYQALLEEAVAEYNAGRYAEARALFLQAHEMEPSARTLRGVGMAAFEMREYVEALHALEAALAFEERPLSDEQREHVQGLVQRTTAYVGRYQVELSPESAELLVDDAPARVEEGVLLLNLGSHTLEGRCPGCRPERRQVRVRGGENELLRFDLRPEDEGPAGASGSAGGMTASVGTQPELPRHRDDSGATGTVLLIGAGVLAAGAAGGVVWWLDRNSELDRCQQAGDACRNEETLSLERGTAITVTVGLGLAAVGSLIGGLVLLGDDDEEDLTLGCAPGLAGVGCVGRF